MGSISVQGNEEVVPYKQPGFPVAPRNVSLTTYINIQIQTRKKHRFSIARVLLLYVRHCLVRTSLGIESRDLQWQPLTRDCFSTPLRRRYELGVVFLLRSRH